MKTKLSNTPALVSEEDLDTDIYTDEIYRAVEGFNGEPDTLGFQSILDCTHVPIDI